jgi:serine/threonine protein phosphatase PrpC
MLTCSCAASVVPLQLKKYIIPDPSVTCHKLTPDCEYVMIGSDGLWDVIGPNSAAIVVCVLHNGPDHF